MADATYENNVYMEQGGDRLVAASGGSIDVESGGEIDIETGGSLKLAGTAISSTAAELNKLDGVTATAAELNRVIDGGMTTAVLDLLIADNDLTLALMDKLLAAGAISATSIAAAAVTQAKMEEGSVVFVDKQLTNAEVLAFRATPIELVAAPGANKAIVVHKFHIVSDDSAGTWTETTDNLVIEYADGVDISAAIEAGSLVGGAVAFITQGVLDTEVVPDVNAAVQIFNTGDGEWGGGNAANTMSIRVWYSVVDTVAFS